MEQFDLTKQFAQRLREAMINAGFNSDRSSTGVSIQQLVQITDYSAQICRKYLRGEAIPEPSKLVEIAQQLKVSAGWLLFGDTDQKSNKEESTVSINKNVLHYILTQVPSLFNKQNSERQIADFLIDLINDLSLINANEEQSKKIIDLAISSINHFNRDH